MSRGRSWFLLDLWSLQCLAQRKNLKLNERNGALRDEEIASGSIHVLSYCPCMCIYVWCICINAFAYVYVYMHMCIYMLMSYVRLDVHLDV